MSERLREFFFIVLGFVMKVVGEVVHEVLGHGFYVQLFGGTIRRVHISPLWPLRTSYIWWSAPGLSPTQEALVVGGGVLNCLVLSFILQAILLLRPQPWRYATPMLWLAFWFYLSSTGYLMVGALRPFGDVAQLISMDILTPTSSLALGLALFTVGFISLSTILRRALLTVVSEVAAGRWVAFFWLTVPLALTAAAFNPQYHASPVLILVGFLPAVVWLLWEKLSKMRHIYDQAQ